MPSSKGRKGPGCSILVADLISKITRGRGWAPLAAPRATPSFKSSFHFEQMSILHMSYLP